jgi:hypothetical protein
MDLSLMNPVLLGIGGWGISTLAILGVVILCCREQTSYWKQRALVAEQVNRRLSRTRRPVEQVEDNTQRTGQTTLIMRMPGYDQICREFADTQHQRATAPFRTGVG